MIRLLKKESLERLFLLIVGFCIIIYGRWNIMGSPPVFQQIDNPASFLTSPIERVDIRFIYFLYVLQFISLCYYKFDNFSVDQL